MSTNCIPLKNRFLFLLFHRQVVYGFFHPSVIWLRIFLNVLKLMFYLNLDYVLRLNTPSCARDEPNDGFVMFRSKIRDALEKLFAEA